MKLLGFFLAIALALSSGGGPSPLPLKPPASAATEFLEVSFHFERRNDGELLEADVEDGGHLILRKRLGRPNYPDTVEVRAEYDLNAAQVKELGEILSRYPLDEITNYRRTGTFAYNVTRTLRVKTPDSNYYVDDFLIFPTELPPMKELMYTEIYNFFNAIAAADPRMEPVWTEQQPDPALNPRYYDRVVLQYGREVHLVPGTGYDDDSDAVIDYGDGKHWWIEEGFVGSYVMTEADKARAGNYEITEDSAAFTIRPDGSFTLTMNGVDYVGTLPEKRLYKNPAGGSYEPADPSRLNEDQSFVFDYNGGTIPTEEDPDLQEELTEEQRLTLMKSHIYLFCEDSPHPFVRYPRYMELTRAA